MPEHLKKCWPKVLGIRCSWDRDRESFWKAYLVWKGERSYQYTVSDFVRYCIEEEVKKQEEKNKKSWKKKSKKG